MSTLSTMHSVGALGVGQRVEVPFGMSVQEIAEYVHGSIEGVKAWIRAPVGHHSQWIELPLKMWKWIRPKVGDAIQFTARPGKSALRSILTIVAIVASVAATIFLTPVVGGLAANLIGAAIGLGSRLLINALFPASSSSQVSSPLETARALNNVDSDSNFLAKESSLPRIAGTRRISPPEIARPRFFLNDGTQSIDRIFAFDGHNSITGIQVDGAPVSDFSAITTEILDGAEATGTETFIDKVTAFAQVGETLSSFSVTGVALDDQSTPANSSPIPVRFATSFHRKMEELVFRLQVSGFYKSDSATQEVAVPIRIRFREKGSSGSWNNLPEIHVQGRDVSTLLKEIRVRWDSDFGGADQVGGLGYQFFQRVPAAGYTLADGTTGDQWQAHAHFVDSSPLTSVQNIFGGKSGIRVILDEDTFPKQEYEWEIVRGISFNKGSVNTTSYAFSADSLVNSFFVGRYTSAQWQIPLDQGAYTASLSMAHATTVVDTTPCQRPNTALLALRSIGQSVRNITVLASRYVYDWDGSGWNTLTTTDNPATHYRQLVYDALSYHGVDTTLINDTAFVSWRAECASKGYRVSYSSAGSSLVDALTDIAASGFARPVFSDQFSIEWFRDRSAELPVQTFSPRNADISINVAEADLPIGIRAKFQNEDIGYKDDEKEITNPKTSNFVGFDVIEYSSIVDPDLVAQRAYFDLLQMIYQGRRSWIVEAPIEAFVCERGDMVGIVTDLLDDTNSGMRIRSVLDKSHFTVDQDIPAQSTDSVFDSANFFNISDLFVEGEQSICLISTPNGTLQFNVAAAETQPEGYMIRIDGSLESEDYSLSDLAGAHIAIGPTSRFLKRVIVSNVNRTSEERAQLICLDEAPEIYTEMARKYY